MATIRGTNGKNRLKGTASKDKLFGLGGNDTLDGRKGADKMYGGKGNDTYLVDHAGDKVIEKAGQGTDTVKSKVTFTLGANVESLALIGSAAINGTGNELANVILGNAGNNILNGGDGSDALQGGAGDDTLIGGVGADVLMGGEGGDSYLYESDDNLDAPDTISDTGASGTDVIVVGTTVSHLYMGGSAISGIEGLTFVGGDHQAASFVQSQFGTGLISTAFQLTGVDGLGQIVEIHQASNFSAADWQFTNWSSTDSISIFGIDSSNDVITGSSRKDSIFGDGGDDIIRGGGGADSLNGGEGSDTYLYTAGEDTNGEVLSDSGTTGIDFIEVRGGGALGLPTYFTLPGGGIEGVRLADAFSQISFTSSQVGTSLIVEGASGLQTLTISDILVSGSTSVDASGWTLVDWTAGVDYMQFYGNGDVNSIKGSTGDDLITGGAGQDSLQGGAGNDTYIYFSHETHGAEVLLDSAGFDKIDLHNAGTFDFTGFATISGIDALTFNAAQTATFYSSTASSVFPTLQVTGATGAQTLYLKPVTVGSTAATIEDYSSFTFSSWTSGTDIVKIDGTFGANTIAGTSQADHIWGDNGADVMTGGGGADRFLYGNVDHSLFATPDVINNFSGAGGDGDKIDFSALASAIGDPLSLTGNNGFDGFSGNGSPEVRYQSVSGTVEVLVDIDGDTAADMKIVVASGLFTAQHDIILA